MARHRNPFVTLSLIEDVPEGSVLECNFDFRSDNFYVILYIKNNTKLTIGIRDLSKRRLQMWHFRPSITLFGAEDVCEGRASSRG
jgi:hypothetical protein